ncbi:2Fe-2S iron-sulfur cluster-binding protein [Streptomyces sp. NPDC088785]|uniref:2Fe-2S iron-sulfur cluster-binding protein n=1 Tax=Streptomyces sp. NPDC088785 TaxID=3365897 RepID=UPI0037F75485
MTNEYPGPDEGDGWQPLPRGEYDSDATAFVQLPPDSFPDAPLAAPGHGYVPPQITVGPATGAAATDPAATGVWVLPPGLTGVAPQQSDPQQSDPRHPDPQQSAGSRDVSWPEANRDPYGSGAAGAAQGATGQWSIPLAGGEIPDDSGEFTTSAPASRWGDRTPPATLPGGAPAPWATQEWAAEAPPAPLPDHAPRPDHAPLPDHAPRPDHAPLPDHAPRPDHAPGPDHDSFTGHEQFPDREQFPGAGPLPDAAQLLDRGPLAGPGPLPEPVERAEPAVLPEPRAPEPQVSARAWVQEAPEAVADEPEPEPDPQPDPQPEAAPEPVADERPAPDGPAEPAAEPSGPAAEEPEPVADGRTGTDRPEPAAEPAPTPEPAAEPEPEAGPEPAAAPLPLHDDHPLASYVLRVNGADRPVTDAWIGESLLYVLRERLGLAGAKDGCSQGECGACNVQVDGRLVASCLVPAATAAGSDVRTVEGLAEEGRPSDVQRALAACGAVQCGFCVPGMAMTVHDLLEGNPDPTDLEARKALCGNLCRCSGYRGVLDAVREVAAERRASRAAAAEQGEPGERTEDGEEPRIPRQAGPASGDLFQDGGQA